MHGIVGSERLLRKREILLPHSIASWPFLKEEQGKDGFIFYALPAGKIPEGLNYVTVSFESTEKEFVYSVTTEGIKFV